MFLDGIPFKNCVFLHLFSNECIIISLFFGKNHYHIKEEEILKMGIALSFSIFFCLVMFHESQK
jgi:hypothetical protein